MMLKSRPRNQLANHKSWALIDQNHEKIVFQKSVDALSFI